MSYASRRDSQMFRRLEKGDPVPLAELRGNEEAGILADALEGFVIGLEIDELVDALEPWIYAPCATCTKIMGTPYYARDTFFSSKEEAQRYLNGRACLQCKRTLKGNITCKCGALYGRHQVDPRHPRRSHIVPTATPATDARGPMPPAGTGERAGETFTCFEARQENEPCECGVDRSWHRIKAPYRCLTNDRCRGFRPKRRPFWTPHGLINGRYDRRMRDR